MSFEWQVTPEQAFTSMFDAYAAQIHQIVYMVCLRRAPEIENWMKQNAPWTDRTGNARQTLHTQVIPAVTEITILLSHSVDYSIYLETKNAGVWGILAPAMDHFLPIIMQDIQDALRP